jgi:hypothetical protein
MAISNRLRVVCANKAIGNRYTRIIGNYVSEFCYSEKNLRTKGQAPAL